MVSIKILYLALLGSLNISVETFELQIALDMCTSKTNELATRLNERSDVLVPAKTHIHPHNDALNFIFCVLSFNVLHIMREAENHTKADSMV